MIKKSEILWHAKNTGLLASIIEKDYVLGWVLAAIFKNPILRKKWVFKGGTCLKKCYFENYRFSEDLDFTILDDSHINIDFLHSVFTSIVDWIYEKSGIDIPKNNIEFETYKNKLGKISCQGKLSYSGPLSHMVSVRQWPRIKLDLTSHEILVESSKETKIIHPYSDWADQSFTAITYTYEEILAEKTRALGERARPRDLYDVINLFRQADKNINPRNILNILEKKCFLKNINTINEKDLDKYYAPCKRAWGEQLSHQLVELPDFESFWNELAPFFNWLQS